MINSGQEKNWRVLVIDDNPAIHEDFRKILCGAMDAAFEEAEARLFHETPAPMGSGGFEIDVAAQGREGWERTRQAVEAGRPYAMAFVDVRMSPGWDGIETTARLWKADPDLQVVICTAYSDYSVDKMIEKLGVSDRMRTGGEVGGRKAESQSALHERLQRRIAQRQLSGRTPNPFPPQTVQLASAGRRGARQSGCDCPLAQSFPPDASPYGRRH
jgi:CheY-like chemotaxis protein